MNLLKLAPVFILLLLLLSFSETVFAADDSIELRSSVISYDASSNIFKGGVPESPINTSRCVVDATNFAGFYYNLDDDISTERFLINKKDANKISIVYKTEPVFQKFAYQQNDWNNQGYSVLGFFAEPYVALSANTPTVSKPKDGVNANRVAPLVIDDRTRYQIRLGDKLSLGHGYTLTVNEVDVNGKTAWMSLKKDGKEIDNGFLSSENPTWILEKDILDERSLQVFRVRLSSVFQGSETSVVEIQGVWLVDFKDAFQVSDDKNYGKFEAESISESSLTYKAEYMLGHNKTESLGNDIKIHVSEGSGSEYKFYIYKEYKNPGQYTIRSSVQSYPGKAVFTPSSFSGLYYDLDEDLWTEMIFVTTDSSSIRQKNLKYISFPVSKKYEFRDWTLGSPRNSEKSSLDRYFVLGIFGEPFVPLNSLYGSKDTLLSNKMAKLVIDSNTKHTLVVGQNLDLGSGYSLQASEINVNGEKVWLNLQKNGRKIADAIVTATGNPDSRTWVLEETVDEEKDIQVMRVHVSQVFQGVESSVVEIKGIWLIDFLNPVIISEGDKFGKFEYEGYESIDIDSYISGSSYIQGDRASSYKALVFVNKDNLSLGKDRDFVIGGNMSLKTSGDGSKYYLYILKTILKTIPDSEVPSSSANTTHSPTSDNIPTSGPKETQSEQSFPPKPTESPSAPDFLIVSSLVSLIVSGLLFRRHYNKK